MLGMMISGLLHTAAVWAQPDIEDAEAEQDAGNPRDQISATGPWAEGITRETMLAANALLREGNIFMRDAFFREAAVKYKEAIALWDHPAFHFNLAMAQRALDQPIEAHRSLDRAVRHGPAALGQSRFEHAGRVRALLEEQLGHVEVICQDAGAEVALDGEELFTGPGARTVLVRPGPHQLVARKAGRIPATEQIAPAPGERVRVELFLRFPDKVIATRRWAEWKPWVVAGAGAAVVTGGAYLDWQSAQELDDYDAKILRMCPEGCRPGELPAGFDEQEKRAGSRQALAGVTYAVGGAALATGLVLVYLNRERVVSVARSSDAPSATVSVSPALSPELRGVRATLRF
jgi:hypothetical protein